MKPLFIHQQQKTEKEKHDVLIEHTEYGRKSEYIECPFCSLVTKAYVVSLFNDKSRECECGALHLHNGMTEKKFVAQ